MNINFKIIDDNHVKHPFTIKDVGYIIIDRNYIRFGKDACDDGAMFSIPRTGTSAKVIAWEDKKHDTDNHQ